MNRQFIIFLFLPVVFLGLLSCNNPKSNNVNITGAFAIYPLTIKWTEEFKKDHPKEVFNISAGGAGKGLTDVLSGAAEVGMFSRKLTDVELQKGIWYIAVAKDAVLPTISAKNPFSKTIQTRGLTKKEFKEIFLSGKSISWGSILKNSDNNNISVFTRSDAAGAAETWASYLDSKQEKIKGIGVFGDPGLADAVSKQPYAIGFNNAAFVYDAKTGNKNPIIDVVPLDLNENGKIDPDENFYENSNSFLKAIADGKYPSPPSRPLFFITKNKPTNPEIVAFLKWVLTDGQKFIKESGYVPLDNQAIQEQLNKLN